MTNKSLLLLAVLAAATLAACDSGSNGVPLSNVVQSAFSNTSETAVPMEINVLDVDPNDDSPTLYDYLLI